MAKSGDIRTYRTIILNAADLREFIAWRSSIAIPRGFITHVKLNEAIDGWSNTVEITVREGI